MQFPLILPLRGKTRKTFLCSAYHLVEHPDRRSLRFPVCVGIDIHGSSYIEVTQKFLHILRCCSIGQHIGGEGMSDKMEQAIRQRLDTLPTILEEDRYIDVQAFTATYRKAEAVVSRYDWELAEWEQIVREQKQSAERPPSKQSVREQLLRLQEEGRKKTRNRNRNYER